MKKSRSKRVKNAKNELHFHNKRTVQCDEQTIQEVFPTPESSCNFSETSPSSTRGLIEQPSAKTPDSEHPTDQSNTHYDVMNMDDLPLSELFQTKNRTISCDDSSNSTVFQLCLPESAWTVFNDVDDVQSDRVSRRSCDSLSTYYDTREWNLESQQQRCENSSPLNLLNVDDTGVFNESVDAGSSLSQTHIDDPNCPLVLKQIMRSWRLKANDWREGDVVWSKVRTNGILWPSIVMNDPDKGTCIDVEGRANVHVRFFADNGRRSWVLSSYVIAFEGREKFLDISKSINKELTKKYPHFCCGFKTRNLTKKWWKAVTEAEKYSLKTRDERLVQMQHELDEIEKQMMIRRRANSEKQKLQRVKRKSIEVRKVEICQVNDEIEKYSSEKPSSPSILPTWDEFTIENQGKYEKVASMRDAYRIRCRRFKLRYADVDYPTFEQYMKQCDDQSDQTALRNQYQSNLKRQQLAFLKLEETDNVEFWRRIKQQFVKSHGDVNVLDVETAMKREFMSGPSRSSLFKERRNVDCFVCHQSANTFRCSGVCLRHFHAHCIRFKPGSPSKDANTKKRKRKSHSTSRTSFTSELNDSVSIINESTETECLNEAQTINGQANDAKICDDCASVDANACFACNSGNGVSKLVQCTIRACSKYYHLECLAIYKEQTQLNVSIANAKNQSADMFICPRHKCHTCTSDEATQQLAVLNGSAQVQCVKCPTAFHKSNFCIAAGSVIYSNKTILCPRHLQFNVKNHINANWCFICAQGGDLVCCETCPLCVHVTCAKVTTSDDGYICDNCESGRFPLYGEIVWAKLATYRWWPARILFPWQVPTNILQKRPITCGVFYVYFFGSHDYYPMTRGRVFSYQEDDHVKLYARKSLDKSYDLALHEAKEAFQLYKQDQLERRLKANDDNVKPPPFFHIKANKPVGDVKMFDHLEKAVTCNCDATGPDPCGPDSLCINRLLLFECNAEKCPAKMKCRNQRFERREYVKLKPFLTMSRGWGLQALQPICKGQFVIEYVGEVISEQEYKRRVQKMQQERIDNYYFLTIDNSRLIDAGPKGNFARFVNHSCQPNCETQKWTVNGETRVGLFALDDIAPNTELTFNYNLESIGKEKKMCKCNAPNCSGFIGIKAAKNKPIEMPTKAKKHMQSNKIPRGRIAKAVCFACKNVGAELRCALKRCSKFFHLTCSMNGDQSKVWQCPRHQCHSCSRTSRLTMCRLCVNSYCKIHAQNMVVDDLCLDCLEKTVSKDVHVEENEIKSEMIDKIDEKIDEKRKRRMNISLRSDTAAKRYKPNNDTPIKLEKFDNPALTDTSINVLSPHKCSTEMSIEINVNKPIQHLSINHMCVDAFDNCYDKQVITLAEHGASVQTFVKREPVTPVKRKRGRPRKDECVKIVAKKMLYKNVNTPAEMHLDGHFLGVMTALQRQIQFFHERQLYLKLNGVGLSQLRAGNYMVTNGVKYEQKQIKVEDTSGGSEKKLLANDNHPFFEKLFDNQSKRVNARPDSGDVVELKSVDAVEIEKGRNNVVERDGNDKVSTKRTIPKILQQIDAKNQRKTIAKKLTTIAQKKKTIPNKKVKSLKAIKRSDIININDVNEMIKTKREEIIQRSPVKPSVQKFDRKCKLSKTKKEKSRLNTDRLVNRFKMSMKQPRVLLDKIIV